MPLEVIRRDRGQETSIFDSLNPFVEKLVSAYKQKKQNEWDNEWMSAMLTDIEIAGSEKSIDAFILKKDPPEGFIDIEGATKFANDSMGMLAQREAIMGEISPTDTTGEQKTGLLPDPKEFNELYQFVSELPTGKIEWANTKEAFKKRLESGREMGAAAQSFLSQILGQGVTDQRQKFEQDFDLAAKMKKELYPETEEDGVVFDPNQFLRDNPNLKITGYNSNTGGYTFGEKEDEEPALDIEKFNKWLTDSGFVIKGGTVNPVTGSQSINFGPAPEGKKSFDQAIKDAEKWVVNNPGMEISNINFATETVSVGQRGKDEPEPGKARPNMDKFLFGDTGIINDDIKGNIEGNYPLSEEEIELVIKNYNLRKHTLTEEEVAEVELYFDQIGIDPNETKTPGVTLPGGPQSKPKGVITKFGENIKSNVLGLKDLIMGDKEGKEEKDEYGYILDEIRVVNGKRYQYKGNDEWLPL